MIDPQQLIEGPAALQWAADWSASTDAAYPRTEIAQEIEALLDSDEKIPYVTRRGDFLYNFWRDENNLRGIWRRTSLEQYRTASPSWEILLDVDALANSESEDWVYKGAIVYEQRALIKLSRGGSDATVVREFDLRQKTFIDGFNLSEAKTTITWLDEDRVLVGTDTGPESLTTSGYPRQLRLWQRGQNIEEAAIIAEATEEDIAIGASVDHLSGRVLIRRSIDFFSSSAALYDEELIPLDVPEDCNVFIHDELLFLLPRTDFAGIPAGGLGVAKLEEFLAGHQNPKVLFQPDERTALQSVVTTRNFLVMTRLVDVATSISIHPLTGGPAIPLDLPDASTAQVVSTSPRDGDEIFINVESFSAPPMLARYVPGTSLEPLRTLPAQFDARGIKTRQHWAVSADGTRVPYFITGKFDNSPRPTLVGGYGGFEVSLLPGYSGIRGRMWLQRGNFYVQPNLRGGGEFGPDWHAQAVKENRHKVWEDHEAVLRDMVRRGYATPEQIGIRGGSNGGLLTAGALNRYPECFGAAVVQVPLTDMLRYHTWTAGASWMAEYGNPDIPEEREFIQKFSPLHNISSDSTYPPALVTTSTRDDRVHPAHARLFAHALAEAGHPVDYFETATGGHAGAADNRQVADLEALIYTWLFTQLEGSGQ